MIMLGGRIVTPPVYQTSNTASVAGGAGSSLTITKPTGVTAGDLLIAVLVQNAANGWNELSGWTRLINTVDDPSTSFQYRIADGTEGASFTFAFTAGTNRASGIVMRFSNATSTYVGSTSFETTGTSRTAPSVTIIKNKSLALSVFTSDQALESWTGVRANVISAFSTQCSFNVSYEEVDAGATAADSATQSSVQNCLSFQVGISN